MDEPVNIPWSRLRVSARRSLREILDEPESYVDAAPSSGRADLTDGKDKINRTEAEQRLADLADNLPGLIFQMRLRPDGVFEVPFVSEGVRDLLGLDVEEIQSIDFNPFAWGADERESDRIRQSLIASAENLSSWRLEFRLRTRGRGFKWMYGRGTPRRLADDSILWNSLIIDVTPIREAEGRARESEDLLQAMFEASRQVHLILDRELHILKFNRLADQYTRQIIGRSLERGTSLRDYVPVPEFLELLNQRANRALEGHYDSYVKRVEWPERGTFWFESRFQPVLTGDEVTGLSISVLDVSGEREARSELELAAQILQGMPMAVLVTDLAGHIKRWRGAPTETFGFEADEIKGRSIADLFQALDAHKLHERITETLAKDGEFSRDLQAMGKGGVAFPVQLVATRLDPFDADPDGGWLVLLQDISARKDLEAQFQQAQKMEALGLLASGVAHDFNNLLTAVLGHAALLRESYGRPREEIDEEVDAIEHAVDAASSLTGKLLAFARTQISEPRVHDVAGLLRGLESLLRRVLEEAVILDLRVEPALWPACIDPSHLEQILLNLVVNARDALPAGGHLDVLADNHVVETDSESRGGAEPGEYIRIRVIDDGLGVPADLVDRIFDPFFTTKDIGRGTGLGLSTCFGLARQLGGYIWCDSRLGQGAAFTLLLPRSTGAIVDSKVKSEAREEGPSGTERILLVEDQENVRRIAARYLSSRGYRVLEAENGMEAERLLALHPSIDVLVTDVVMPILGGLALAEEYKRRNPEGLIVFMSGYAGEAVGQGALEAGPDRTFLPKPFVPAELAMSIRRLLDKSV